MFRQSGGSTTNISIMGASQHENKGAQMTPSQSKLEQRVSNLETEMEQLKRQLDQLGGGKQPWWEQIIGTFEDDPIYDEAMKRGREYRESLRPKTSTRRQE